MFKNNLKKFTVGTLALGTMLAGVSLAPNFAQAHDDVKSNLQINANGEIHKNKNSGVKFNHETSMGLGLGFGNINFDMNTTASGSDQNSIKEIIKPAKKELKQSVKTANTNFKEAKKTARAEFKASVNENTSKADRIAAMKVYFTKVLTALTAKNNAVEAALQAFINTNFSI